MCAREGAGEWSQEENAEDHPEVSLQPRPSARCIEETGANDHFPSSRSHSSSVVSMYVLRLQFQSLVLFGLILELNHVASRGIIDANDNTQPVAHS